MIDILSHQSLTLNHFMCSQSGNLQDLANCSGHSPSCSLESDAEPDSSSRQNHLPSLQASDMGFRYMNIQSDDARYSDTGTSHSPVYSVEPNIHNPNSPTSLTYFTQLYPNNLSSSNYASTSGSSYFSPAPSLFSMPEIKSRSSLNSSPGMAPPSRSPALPHLASPRDIYNTGAQPHLRRTSDLLSRSPSISGGLRGVPLSPTSSGFTSPTNMENTLGGQALSPPLGETETVVGLRTSEGHPIHAEIFGKIDKGFFLADSDWTCYRRNYFSLNCSYSLTPSVPVTSVHLAQVSSPQVHAFALSIAAVVDGRDGKAIELVQHTPKRDKGPQDKPARITLAPRPSVQGGIYGESGIGSGSRGLYDQGYGQTPAQPPAEATFERIQFKNATANNGKRRAAQQYYHLIVELFADLGPQHQDRWVKVAIRMSAAMVVRGRSPGHYQSERRGSNASTGPGGSGGAGGGGSYTPSGSTSRTPGDISMSGANSMLPSSGYGSSYDTRSHHYRSNIGQQSIPMEPVLSQEEAKGIEEAPGYVYYPGTLYENERYNLPSFSGIANQKIKQEPFASSPNYTLPSLASHQETFGRHCGRWEGVTGSKGYFPMSVVQQDMDITS